MSTDTTAKKRSLEAVLKALGSEQRLEILRILGGPADPAKSCCGPREVCACRLSERLGLAQSTVSHHMSVLRSAGIVSARKDGLWVYYTLHREALEEAAEALRRI